ncbi:DUF1294 domain-containing protein [Pseudomonas sp. URMO17WK12:I11]|uniref:DUF1294 domain-containing protein n=1 Tax=Pseudomonas sp. URMO17WK12:I11 TaxID=1283291 RepID=UPI0011AAAAC3|nr:DUF1294 domain-containing protein [Pseudomonas sp. URMO17WK12:I11]
MVEQPDRQRPAQIRNVRFKGVLLGLLCVLPVLGVACLAYDAQAWWPLVMYPVMSLFSMLLYWRDKAQARTQARRIPEKLLHGTELLGGWPGALLAQQLFRHKTRKVSYQVTFWAIVVVHQAAWSYWLVFQERAAALG